MYVMSCFLSKGLDMSDSRGACCFLKNVREAVALPEQEETDSVTILRLNIEVIFNPLIFFLLFFSALNFVYGLKPFFMFLIGFNHNVTWVNKKI